MCPNAEYKAVYKTIFREPENLLKLYADLCRLKLNIIIRKQFVEISSHGDMQEIKFYSRDVTILDKNFASLLCAHKNKPLH